MVFQTLTLSFLVLTPIRSTVGWSWIANLGGGGVVTLYVVSCMWALKITVINSKALQQYRVQHHAPLKGVNTAIVFNVSCHFIAAGESQHLFHVIAFIASQQEIWLPVWVKLFLGKFLGSPSHLWLLVTHIGCLLYFSHWWLMSYLLQFVLTSSWLKMSSSVNLSPTQCTKKGIQMIQMTWKWWGFWEWGQKNEGSFGDI